MSNQIILTANVNRSQIDVTKTHYNIKSIPITVDDAVMNSVLYSAAENKKGMPTMVGNPVTLGHPVIDGQNASGRQGEGLEDYYSGGTIRRTYNKSGVWYADASIKKSILNAQDGGEVYAQMLENKESIGVSTGLTFEDNDISGTNNKGESYTKSAINQEFDHLAMLADEEPAGGSDTVMRFNVADIMPKPKESWTTKALGLFKLMFKTNEMSHDEIHSKLYQKLNKGKSDNEQHSWPMEVYSTSFIYRSSDDILYKQSYGMDGDDIVLTGSPVEVERVIEYKPVTNNNDGDLMDRKTIIGLLAAKNISVNEDITDADLEAKLTEVINKADPAPAGSITLEQVTAAVNAAVKPLQDQITANANAKLDELKTQMKAMTTNRLSDSLIEKMDEQEMKDHLAANGAVAFNTAGGQHVNNSNDGGYSADMPE